MVAALESDDSRQMHCLDNAPVKATIMCCMAQYLSEEDVQKHSTYLCLQGYEDVGSFRIAPAMQACGIVLDCHFASRAA